MTQAQGAAAAGSSGRLAISLPQAFRCRRAIGGSEMTFESLTHGQGVEAAVVARKGDASDIPDVRRLRLRRACGCMRAGPRSERGQRFRLSSSSIDFRCSGPSFSISFASCAAASIVARFRSFGLAREPQGMGAPVGGGRKALGETCFSSLSNTRTRRALDPEPVGQVRLRQSGIGGDHDEDGVLRGPMSNRERADELEYQTCRRPERQPRCSLRTPISEACGRPSARAAQRARRERPM